MSEQIFEDIFKISTPTSSPLLLESFKMIEDILLVESSVSIRILAISSSITLTCIAGLVIHLAFGGIRQYLIRTA